MDQIENFVRITTKVSKIIIVSYLIFKEIDSKS